MCQECVDKGLMTQEELDREFTEGPKHINRILESLKGEREEVVINVLLSCLVNASVELNIPSNEIILALMYGFGIHEKEMKKDAQTVPTKFDS